MYARLAGKGIFKQLYHGKVRGGRSEVSLRGLISGDFLTAISAAISAVIDRPGMKYRKKRLLMEKEAEARSKSVN